MSAQYHLHTQDDGLRIACESLPQMESVAIAVSVDVGARWERPVQHGLSHLLEHMAFKGTPRYSAQRIAEIFDGIGGQFNAFTSHEHTVYYVRVLKAHWQQAADILCDILMHSLFDADELAREKEVILQELAMHHDTPDDLVFDLFQEAAFGEQALGRSILGTMETIRTHPRQALLDFVAEHYRAPRIVVSAAGAVEAEALQALMSEKLRFNTGGAAAPEPAAYVGGQRLIAKDLEQLQLLIGLPSLPHGDARYYPLQLLCHILGGGMSSRLFQEVREKRGLVYSIQSFNASYADCGTLGIYAATGVEQADELIGVIADELHRLAETLSEEELERARRQQVASLRMARESTTTLAEWIGRHLLQYGEYRDADWLQTQVEAVTLAEVKALAEDLLRRPALSLAALGPAAALPSGEQVARRLAA